MGLAESCEKHNAGLRNFSTSFDETVSFPYLLIVRRKRASKLKGISRPAAICGPVPEQSAMRRRTAPRLRFERGGRDGLFGWPDDVLAGIFDRVLPNQGMTG
ncbi:MAG: hypothetical protein ACLQU2_27915 [Candidatus Binataceae bacterium]